MAATYTFDVISSLDGFGGYDEHGDWGGFWGKHGPEFLERRLSLYDEAQRLVLGANTFRQMVQMLGADLPPSEFDPANDAMTSLPTTVVSSTLAEPLAWPNASVASGDAVEIVRKLKQESDVPLLSHGSLSLNRTLMAAGLVDVVRVSLCPVVAGRTGDDPVFSGADDLDLELLGSRTFDGRILELTYRPTLHG